MVVCPNIFLLTFMNFYKKITNKCKRIGSKQISFVRSMTSQVTFTYYLLLNTQCELLVNDFINSCNMIETAFDYLRMGCILVFLVELLHFNSPL